MKEFDMVIGYDSIKEELFQIIDMVKNKERYAKLGAKLPKGIILEGDPGLGKTLMAKCFIKASGLPTFTIRRDKGNDDFIGGITETFKKARENAPAIVFLDDMDKFSNDDVDHVDSEEYVAVQAGIDESKDYEVFVIATVNNMRKLPGSLTRAGRFDRIVEFAEPTMADAMKIIEFYLKNKPIGPDVNMDDIAKMISYSSCAELESILNEAAVYAGFENSENIAMKHLLRAVLRSQYNSPDNDTKTTAEELDNTAWHEAGHLVIAESLVPGSVGLISVRSTGRSSTGGFVHRCKDLGRRPYEILVSLGGKVSTEMHFGRCASGCGSDLSRAAETISQGILGNATMGYANFDVTGRYENPTDQHNYIVEKLTAAEMEKMTFKAREILFANHEFLTKIHDALIEKETLLFSDIQKIKSECTIKAFEI